MLFIPLEVLKKAAIVAVETDKAAYQIYGKKSILTIINVKKVFFIFTRIKIGRSGNITAAS